MLSRMVGRFLNCFSLKNFMFGNKDDDNDGFDDDEAESSTSVPDPCQWAGKDLERHSFGDFSFCAVQANLEVEDYGQVETGYGATFAGIYDGHGGHQCAQYISEHLFNHFTRIIQEEGTISEEVLRNAFAATEEGFLGVVQREFETDKAVAARGSCCLIGVIWNNTIYIANAGDSRAVLGCAHKKKIIAHDLNSEHNAKHEEVREELRASHPDDPDIVLNQSGSWRVKGLIQVSRSIGDAYLKRPEYAFGIDPRSYFTTPITRPVLSAGPSTLRRTIQPQDRFIIFASDGLWDLLSSQEAARVVHKNPRAGIARRLIRRALNRRAKMGSGGTYENLKRYPAGERRIVHDDITVIVIFIDHDLLETATPEPQLSIRTFGDLVASSGFNVLQALITSDQPPPELPST